MRFALLLSTLILWFPAHAEVRITSDLLEVIVETADGPVAIRRDPNPEATIDPDFARTSRACPPFCIQPISPAPGVTTVGELELLDFVASKRGVLVDGRTDDWYLRGTIPGAVNIPYTEVAMRLDELGCTKGGDAWDCSDAVEAMLFCNGPWCGQSPMAIRAMVREGYPAGRIFYYRGGMQAWKILGLTTVEGSW